MNQERVVLRYEGRLKLQDVSYTSFENAVRKYGHRADLNEVHLKAISTTIKLNFTELKEHKESFYSLIYNDTKAFHRYGKYNVMNLLKLGFLNCKHTSQKDQENELWNIVNPELSEKIPKARAR